VDEHHDRTPTDARTPPDLTHLMVFSVLTTLSGSHLFPRPSSQPQMNHS